MYSANGLGTIAHISTAQENANVDSLAICPDGQLLPLHMV